MVAWDTDTTIIVWEPAPQGGLQLYVNKQIVGVYVGTVDGREDTVIHLLDSDGGVITEDLASGTARVWDRRPDSHSQLLSHFDLLVVPPGVVGWIPRGSEALHWELQQNELPQHHRQLWE